MGQEKIYYCIGCGKTHNRGEFYKSYNTQHKNGVYPFCKDYIKNEVYLRDGSIDVEKFKSLLMQMDAPFLIDEFEGALDDKRETIGTYFSRINMVQNRGLRWKDSSSSSDDKVEVEKSEADEEFDRVYLDDFKPTGEMLLRWGENYSNVEIGYLEKFYQDMHTTHTIVTPQHEKALIMICKLQLKMDNFLEADDMVGFAKVHTEYQKLLQSSGLRPIDKIGGAEAAGIRSFGQIYEELEKDGFIKPEPIEESQDIVDRTIQYILNYTLKLLNKEVLTEPPLDTPKVDGSDL